MPSHGNSRANYTGKVGATIMPGFVEGAAACSDGESGNRCETCAAPATVWPACVSTAVPSPETGLRYGNPALAGSCRVALRAGCATRASCPCLPAAVFDDRRVQMHAPPTSPVHATASASPPSLQWGWLAFVAGLHAAGLAWLGGLPLAGEPRPASAPAISVALLAPPAPPAPAAHTASTPAEPKAPPVRHTARQPAATPTPRQQHAATPPEPPVQSATAISSPPAPQPAPVTPDEPPGVQASSAQSLTATAPEDRPPAAGGTQAARFDAAYLRNPPPPYPPASRRRGEEGQVILRVHVGRDGLPLHVEVAESSRHPRLDQAALQAVARWRVEPARPREGAGDSWLRVAGVLRLQNG